jgi:hypothetical protein
VFEQRPSGLQPRSSGGILVELRRAGTKTLFHDCFQVSYDHDRPLLGAMRFLVTSEVITEDVRELPL